MKKAWIEVSAYMVSAPKNSVYIWQTSYSVQARPEKCAYNAVCIQWNNIAPVHAVYSAISRHQWQSQSWPVAAFVESQKQEL